MSNKNQNKSKKHEITSKKAHVSYHNDDNCPHCNGEMATITCPKCHSKHNQELKKDGLVEKIEMFCHNCQIDYLWP